MKGIELSEKFYNQYGKAMLENNFPELCEIVAIGLCGSGSQCFGFDDELSEDHDFEPGFCIFIPDESIIDEKTAFALEKAYSSLPKEFMGYKRSTAGAVGGNRYGVIRQNRFLTEKTGTADGELQAEQWFFVPEQSLLEATNGKLFRDDLGSFTEIRQRLSFFPEDIRLKKLAGELVMAGQAGQYNFSRCIKRGDTAAAQLSVYEFCKSCMHIIFLLNKKYMPYYKWSFKAMKELHVLAYLSDDLEMLISSSNTPEQAEKKANIIENICEKICNELCSQGLSDYKGAECEGHAYAVNNMIKDSNIRNLNILYGV